MFFGFFIKAPIAQTGNPEQPRLLKIAFFIFVLPLNSVYVAVIVQLSNVQEREKCKGRRGYNVRGRKYLNFTNWRIVFFHFTLPP